MREITVLRIKRSSKLELLKDDILWANYFDLVNSGVAEMTLPRGHRSASCQVTQLKESRSLQLAWVYRLRCQPGNTRALLRSCQGKAHDA
jgi:hypothetical protein